MSIIMNEVKEFEKIVVNKYTLSGDNCKQTLDKLLAKDMLFAINILYTVASSSKLKITQKREIAVRSKKLLLAQIPEGYPFSWLINLLINNKYLEHKKLLLPTNKFHKLMLKSDGGIIKDIFNDMLNLEYNTELFHHIFQASATKGKYVKNFRKMLVELIKEHDKSLWINIDDLVDKININNMTMKDITNDYEYCYAFYGNSKRIKYNKIEHLKVVIRYFLKTFFGIMHQMGLCDLGVTKFQVYNKEDVKILQGLYEYETHFDNIEYYKLTESAHYIFGFNTTFENQNDYKLLLNAYNYEVKVEHSNKLSNIYLEKIATKVDDTKYKVDIKSIMKNITSHLEYQNIKETFIAKVEHLPQNWKQFFALLDERVDAISVVSKSVVLMKIQNNRDILKLISSNVKLQKKILKADKFHIVVLEEDFISVKNILKEYGVVVL